MASLLAPMGRIRSHLRYPFGRPLRRVELPHQVLSKRYALAVFGSDNLSSVAYATEEILVVLAAAGSAFFGLSLWITGIIMLGYAVMLTSYRQTIFAYPNGGGAYIVSRDNLGEAIAQGAGAALLVDYILTVSVSIAAGVANLSSGIHQFVPSLPEFNSMVRTVSSVLMLFAMWYVNKRGVRESGRAFSVPTYFFLISTFLMLGAGLFEALTGHLGRVHDVANTFQPTRSMTLFLLLRAYANGNTAVTGVEAISNGIQAFEDPKPRNAANTMAIMGVLVAVMFFAITKLALMVGAEPSQTETVISQLGRTVFGPRSPFYVAIIFGTAAILIMAANTSFADFPRLAALHAGDGFLPRWMLDRDNRLVFGIGISVLSIAAGVLLIVFQASVDYLIPLYAIGVFLSITLSQAGMVVHWRRVSRLKPGEAVPRYSPEGMLVTTLRHTPDWQWRMALSAVGAATTAVITVVFIVAKFTEGAWIVVVLVPLLLMMFFRIHDHYTHVQDVMTLDPTEDVRAYIDAPEPVLNVLVIGSLQRHTLPALRHLRQIGNRAGRRIALHVDVNTEETGQLRAEWRAVGLDQLGIPLKILPSEYGAGDVIGNIVAYVRGALAEDPDLRVNLLIADWAAGRSRWSWLLTPALHHLTGARLRTAFLSESRVTVTNYRYLVSSADASRQRCAKVPVPTEKEHREEEALHTDAATR